MGINMVLEFNLDWNTSTAEHGVMFSVASRNVWPKYELVAVRHSK